MMKALKQLLSVMALLAVAFWDSRAGAECYGLNVLDLMPAEERAGIEAAAEAVPFPAGNFWTAEKDGIAITVIGTYHLDDPRHDAAITRFTPVIAASSTLLVEAGPEEEKALMERIGKDPSVMMITEGPTLVELLPPDLWAELKEATAARGIPGFMAAKFRPWYITVLLSMPPCAMENLAKPKGLDGNLIEAAQAAGVPVRALEPYDTVFKVFDIMTEEEQIEMIAQTLALEDQIADFSVTLADAYFDGENRLMWELMRHQSYKVPGYTREQVDHDMARMEEALVNSRNRDWIPVIEAAAAKGPLVVAFGALHLSGEEGVLNLLAGRGWTVSPLTLP